MESRIVCSIHTEELLKLEFYSVNTVRRELFKNQAQGSLISAPGIPFMLHDQFMDTFQCLFSLVEENSKHHSLAEALQEVGESQNPQCWGNIFLDEAIENMEILIVLQVSSCCHSVKPERRVVQSLSNNWWMRRWRQVHLQIPYISRPHWCLLVPQRNLAASQSVTSLMARLHHRQCHSCPWVAIPKAFLQHSNLLVKPWLEMTL